MSALHDIAKNGFWKQNPLLVQLLGLCPLLAISTSLVNAVSLGLATILVMLLANFAVAGLRALIPYEIRIPVFVLIIAALVTVVDLSFNAFLHDLYLVLGIFIPLIVTNCIVLARVEAFAAKNGLAAATLDGVMMGVGFLWVIALIGGLRTARPGHAVLRHRDDFPFTLGHPGAAGGLPRLFDHDAAAGRILYARPVDRRAQLDRGARQPAAAEPRPSDG